MEEVIMEVVKRKRSQYVVPMVVTACFALLLGIPFLFLALYFGFLPMLFFVGLSIAQLIVRKKSSPLKKRKILLVLSIIKMSLTVASALPFAVGFVMVTLMWIPFFFISMIAVLAFLMFILTGFLEICLIREMPMPACPDTLQNSEFEA